MAKRESAEKAIKDIRRSKFSARPGNRCTSTRHPRQGRSRPLITRPDPQLLAVTQSRDRSLLTPRSSLFGGKNSLLPRVGKREEYVREIVPLAAQERPDRPGSERFPCIFPWNRETQRETGSHPTPSTTI